MSALEITVFAKSGGPLTKRISLAADGSLKSDGSACVMSAGAARRFEFSDIGQLTDLIEHLEANEAITLGALRGDLPDRVVVTTKRKLNGGAQQNIIARTSDYLVYTPGQPALALVDHDTKAMPHDVYTRINQLGGVWPALASVVPALEGVSHIMRSSTSAGMFRVDNGERIAGSGGLHAFLLVRDGTDIERFLKILHARCWLAGLGWMMVGAGGQLLERSIVDRVVGSPERLVFEGPPVLDPPLEQDIETRRCRSVAGEALDSVTACPPLTILEEAKLRELRAKEAQRLAPESAKARENFIDRQTHRLVERTGIDPKRACRAIERQCDGVLLPDVELPFDDEELAGATVADVLADPAGFEGATLADPLEGVEYGCGKAKIMRWANGTPWINSFAHGGMVYELRFDHRTAKAAMDRAAPDEADAVFVHYALAGDLDESEIEALRNFAHERSGTTKRALDRRLRSAQQKLAGQRARQERNHRIAERQDSRPQIPAPAPEAQWLPIMEVLNDVLRSSSAPEPPMRNANKFVVITRSQNVPSLHILTTVEANDESDD